jgi:hypothetical protein
MLRFMEREGYDVTYVTNVDLHERESRRCPTRKAFLSVGHDEYWSYQAKRAPSSARPGEESRLLQRQRGVLADPVRAEQGDAERCQPNDGRV